MTEITADLLRQKIAEMHATIAMHNGAVQFAEYLLSVLEENDGMPVAEFAQAVAGNGAVAEGIKAVEQ